MIRSLAVFVVLFAGAIACVSLLPTPARTVAPRSAVAAQLRNAADPAQPQPSVRIVYPAPDASTAQRHPEQSAGGDMPASAVVPTQAATPAGATTADPQLQTTPEASVAVTPPDAVVKAGTQALNLNTASVEALNQIPGAGRIGRMIASHRPYRSVEDLLAKRVIRKSVYDRIKDQVAAE